MKSDLLLFIGDNKNLLDFAQQIAGLIDLKFHSSATFAEGVEAIDQKNPSSIFVSIGTDLDFKKFENEVQKKIGLYSIKINPNTIFYITSHDLSAMTSLITSPLFGNIVKPKIDKLPDSVQHFARLIKFTLLDKAFGLENFFGDKVNVQSIMLTNSTQKIRAVESVRKLISAVGFKTRCASVVSNAVDEIVMNAIFDAPVDDLGKPLFDKTNRSLDLNLDEHAKVQLKIGYDGQYVGISVIDQFGSLDKAKLISHISKKYQDEDYQVRESRAGAGIGMGTVHRLGGSILFASEAQVKTEVTVFFKNLASYADFKNQFKFFSNQFYF